MRETIQNANGKQFHAVSLSGGKDSTAMLLLMIERDMPIDMVLSADTGMEFPEMYEHLAKLDEHLFRERGIHITTLRHPKGFEYLMFDEPKQKPRSLENRARLGIPPYGNGWPGIRVRWCTGQLKTPCVLLVLPVPAYRRAAEAAKASPRAVGKADGAGSPCAGAVRHRPAGTVQAELERRAAGYAVCRGGRPNRLTALRKGLKQYGCISR